MVAGSLLACVALCIFNIWDLQKHNKKVDSLWPDSSDQKHLDMRLKYKIRLGGEYLLLVFLIGLFITQLIGELS